MQSCLINNEGYTYLKHILKGNIVFDNHPHADLLKQIPYPIAGKVKKCPKMHEGL